MAFFGDGTTNIGAFHEALNLAATWKLPVIFVCENNLYMEYTPISEVAPPPAADRASAYGLAPLAIDGNGDVDVVYSTGARSQSHVPALGDGPSLIEAADLRPRRPFPGRPRQVPAGARGCGVASSAIPSLACGTGCSAPA